MNAGDLGSILMVCACTNDPIHVTAQGKSIRVHCACGWSELLFKDQTWCVYVLYSIPYLGGHGNKMLTFLMLIKFGYKSCALIGPFEKWWHFSVL